jgi:hypothetical protein
LARESGISLPTLSRWRHKLAEAAATRGFVEVVPARRAVGSGDGMAIEIEFRGGHRLALSGAVDAETVESVLTLLSRSC